MWGPAGGIADMDPSIRAAAGKATKPGRCVQAGVGMKRMLRVLGAVTVVAACGVSSALGQSLERRVEAAVEKAKLGNASVGVSVLDVATGRELVSVTRNAPREGFIPASNQKLLTSGAAVLTLGADHEFRTEFVRVGDRLIVKGSGDPALGDPELLDKMRMTVDGLVDRLIESIGKPTAQGAMPGGIREVVIDDRVFERELVHPTWPVEQLNRAYCAPVSGMNFHGNVLNVYVGPGKGVGSEPTVRTQPSAPWINVKKLARTVAQGSTEVWLEREGDDVFGFRLHGTVRGSPGGAVQVAVRDPSMMFARVLAEGLGRAGLGEGGRTPGYRVAAADEQIGSGEVVAVVRTPLSVVLERCNVDSDNLYAESLLKAVGHRATGQPGSWANGAAVVRMRVNELLGADQAVSMVMTDGSGLSRENRVTPQLLTRWLAKMSGVPGGDVYIQSLPVAGEEGTLKKRFKGSKLSCEVRAKSGYIRGVRSLSGYITEPTSGRRLAFSVLVNGVSGTDSRAKDLHEDVVEIADQFLAGK